MYIYNCCICYCIQYYVNARLLYLRAHYVRQQTMRVSKQSEWPGSVNLASLCNIPSKGCRWYQRWAESGSKGFESESESLHFARIRIRIHPTLQWIRVLIRILVQRIRIRICESIIHNYACVSSYVKTWNSREI